MDGSCVTAAFEGDFEDNTEGTVLPTPTAVSSALCFEMRIFVR